MSSITPKSIEFFDPSFFYSAPTEHLAKQLLGSLLCRKRGAYLMTYYIVETEAYLGITDPACHSYQNRRTPRTQAMYLPGGHSYVYPIYGMYHCFNVVTQAADIPEAILIRALQPAGIMVASTLNPKQLSPLTLTSQLKTVTKKQIKTNGPGKLCQALGITKTHNALPLWDTNSSLFLLRPNPCPTFSIQSSARIGVHYAGEAQHWPLRFFIEGNPFVSRS
ncbi:MAG: DNA-3-methyladenine glycosylase [Bdellovibrionaceae bacterium]|jgi:DNA-3-methyladenine glycosylase|nr:DNA-3-methyladenine glycosylase [Pseudobdellovibrionaceae bacterium]